MQKKRFKNHGFKSRIPKITYDRVCDRYLHFRKEITRLIGDFHSEVRTTNVGEAVELIDDYEKDVRFVTDEVGYELGVFDYLAGQYEKKGE